MSHNKNGYAQIRVASNILIVYDPGDSWLGIENDDWADLIGFPGAVVIAVDEIDALIVALGQVREVIKK